MREVADDLQQPWPERLTSTEAREGGVRAKERLLAHVLRGPFIAHGEPRHAQRHLLVALHEAPERFEVPREGALDVRVISIRIGSVGVHALQIHRPSAPGSPHTPRRAVGTIGGCAV